MILVAGARATGAQSFGASTPGGSASTVVRVTNLKSVVARGGLLVPVSAEGSARAEIPLRPHPATCFASAAATAARGDGAAGYSIQRWHVVP